VPHLDTRIYTLACTQNDSFLSMVSLKLQTHVDALSSSNLATAAKALAELRYDDEVRAAPVV